MVSSKGGIMNIFFLALQLFFTPAQAELSANACGPNITEQQLLKKFYPGNSYLELGTATVTVEKRTCYQNNSCSPWEPANDLSIGFIDRGNYFVTFAPLLSTTVGLSAILQKDQVLIQLNFLAPGRIDLENGLFILGNQTLSSRSFLYTTLSFPNAGGTSTLHTSYGNHPLSSFLIGGIDGDPSNVLSRASFEFKGSLSQSGCLHLEATASAAAAWNALSSTKFRATIKSDNLFAL